jgi:hypothetical protein
MRNSSKNESTCPCICVAVGTAVVSIDEMWSSTALSHTATTTASRLRRLPILVRNRRPDLKTCLPCRSPQAPCPNFRRVTAQGSTPIRFVCVFLLCIIMAYASSHSCFYQNKNYFYKPKLFCFPSHMVPILNPSFLFFNKNLAQNSFKRNKIIFNILCF